MTKIVVLGAGIGGVPAAFELRTCSEEGRQYGRLADGVFSIRPVEPMGGGQMAQAQRH